MPPRKPPDEPDEAGLPPEPEEDETAALGDLASLADQLRVAAAESAEESRVADEVFARIGRLSRDAQVRLFSRPAIRSLFDRAGEVDAPSAPDDPPGTVYYKTIDGQKTAWGKKPWTWPDLYNPRGGRTPMPTRTWEPSVTITLVWNGLPVTVVAHQEVTLPEVFYGLYRDHFRAEMLGREHAEWLMKKRDRLTDPSIVTPEGAVSRAVANHDGRVNIYAPGGGVPALDHAGDYDAEPVRRGP